MKRTMILLVSVAITCSLYINADAAILRVNNSVSMAAPFTSLSAAITAASAGDTIYIEGSLTTYTGVSINKPIRIIGPGYFLNEPNPHTQADTLEAMLNSISFNAGSNGSVIQGVRVNTMHLRDSFITIERCHIGSLYLAGEATTIYGDTLRNNYFTTGVISPSGSGASLSLLFYNNIFTGSYPLNINSLSNAYVVNNTFAAPVTSSFICNSFLFQNNIMKNPNFGSHMASNAFYNNISTNASGIPTGSGNILGADWTSLFTGDVTATTDGRFKLSPSSVAKNAGVINATTVDCGAFGGAAPYVLSGMPNVPSIYELVVPDAVPSGTSTMMINIGAASH